jgi:Tfp pilus assembly protein PilP
MKRSVFWLQVLLGCVWLSSPALAWRPKESKTPPLPAAAASTAAAVSVPAAASQAVVVPSYKYEVKGRRDPFRNLDVVNTIRASSAPVVRPPGLKGQMVSDISLVGIVKSKSEYMAVATGHRGKTYFIHPSDELYDGRVLQIRSDAVVFSQILTDSRAKKISQQVVKKLYQTRGEGNDAK